MNLLFLLPTKNDIEPKLTTNLDTFVPKKVAQFGFDIDDTTINKAFIKYGGINILPAKTKTSQKDTSKKRVTPQIVGLSVEETEYWNPILNELEEKNRRIKELEEKTLSKEDIQKFIQEAVSKRDNEKKVEITEETGDKENDKEVDIQEQKELDKLNFIAFFQKNWRYATIALFFIALAIIAGYGIYNSGKDDKDNSNIVTDTSKIKEVIEEPVISQKERNLYDELNKKVAELVKENRYSDAIELMNNNKNRLPSFTNDIRLKTNELKNKKAKFIANLNAKQNTYQEKYNSLISKINQEYVNKRLNKYSDAIDLLINSKKSFNKTYKTKINNKIKDLEKGRIRFVKIRQVQDYIKNNPFNYKERNKFLTNAENAEKADEVTQLDKSKANCKSYTETWFSKQEADFLKWKDSPANRKNQVVFSTPAYKVKALLNNGKTTTDIVSMQFSALGGTIKYTQTEINKIKNTSFHNK